MTKNEQHRARTLAMQDLAEMELAELREALQISQEDLAKKLKVTQAAVSRLERRRNVRLDKLSSYVNALGGKLELRIVLPDRTIGLSHLFATRNVTKARAAMRKHREGGAARGRSVR
jgi:transcriptional regulator with XRE-family HTH domain